ncbi:9561_t:CDS:10 [Entrophospora sp. SA101]|nr:9561_t:CDS:10 [Entrophospora sp. SA101]
MAGYLCETQRQKKYKKLNTQLYGPFTILMMSTSCATEIWPDRGLHQLRKVLNEKIKRIRYDITEILIDWCSPLKSLSLDAIASMTFFFTRLEKIEESLVSFEQIIRCCISRKVFHQFNRDEITYIETSYLLDISLSNGSLKTSQFANYLWETQLLKYICSDATSCNEVVKWLKSILFEESPEMFPDSFVREAYKRYLFRPRIKLIGLDIDPKHLTKRIESIKQDFLVVLNDWISKDYEGWRLVENMLDMSNAYPMPVPYFSYTKPTALNDEEEEKKKATFVIRNSSPSLSSINGKKRKKHTGMISEFFKSTNFNTNNNHRLLEWFFDSEDEEEQEKELLLAFNPSYDLNKIVKNWKLIMDYDEFSNLKPINFTPKGSQATPLLWKFLEEYPTPYKAIKADVNELVNLLRPLGLQNIRAIRIIKFSCSYLLNPNFSTPKELFGMGQYAEDSWKLFCGEKDNAWKTIEPEDKILKMYVDWRREQHNN